MRETRTHTPQTATATRRGTRSHNADAALIWSTGQTTVATVVDGIGNSAEVAANSRMLADVIARVAAHRGGLPALLAGADLLGAPAGDGGDPDAVAVVAVPSGNGTVVHWIGDARAYGWDGRRLRRYTTDQTVGEQLRVNGAPWHIAAENDNWVRATLRSAVIAAIYDVEIPVGEMVLLVSDGVPDGVPDGELATLLGEYDRPRAEAAAVLDAARRDQAPFGVARAAAVEAGKCEDLGALAAAIVAAAVADEAGYRDDATVVLLRPAAGDADSPASTTER